MRGVYVDDDGATRGEEQAGVPVPVPADQVGRPSPRFVALEYFSGAVHLPLMGGANKDPVSDMSFHSRLQGLCVLGHSLPVRAEPIKSLRDWAQDPVRRLEMWAADRVEHGPGR